MSKILRGSLITVIVLLVMMLPPPVTMAAVMSTSLPSVQATIVNSGSTNTCPYTIMVLLNGTATYTTCNRAVSGTLSPSLTMQFFEHIVLAQPLDNLPRIHCLKSVSFGTTTTLLYADGLTSDISCPSRDSRIAHLFTDTILIRQQITHLSPGALGGHA